MQKGVTFIVAIIAVAIVGYLLFGNSFTSNDQAPVDVANPAAGGSISLAEPVLKARALAAEAAGVSADDAIVKSDVEKEWPNSCLGLAEEGEMCAEVITPGYEVVVEAAGKIYTYRTNREGSVIRRAE